MPGEKTAPETKSKGVTPGSETKNKGVTPTVDTLTKAGCGEETNSKGVTRRLRRCDPTVGALTADAPRLTRRLPLTLPCPLNDHSAANGAPLSSLRPHDRS